MKEWSDEWLLRVAYECDLVVGWVKLEDKKNKLK